MKRTQPSSAKPKSPAAKSRAKSPRPASARSAAKPKPPPAKSTKPTKKPPATRAAAPEAATTPAPATKQSQLIILLGTGASMAQMIKLTGWQPHTVRGMLSGSLRKRLGLNVQYQMEEGVRVYRIVEAQAQ
ncbi:DUF3489 domain-containing protein [Hydrogenophaga sp. SNF1]|uniref:DUF3489 domain-containing protein n=1 Tax=Hydrogenophaga sp. SNF1 TaxID=3098762 RepID=UPI002ACC3201|nr:DUF3489 domain-containing protein [Hydrogenophaga sp. SNF1]WQB84729.1 DUF3489 domain-containing protein [Hydrogenophaga sp. SNF1]